jgi:hypothetical protein
MAANPNIPGELVTGVVAGVNPKGLRLGGESEWRNFSKFAANLTPPAKGTPVALTLDRQGWIRSIELAEASTDRQHGPSAGRDATITRLAVLKAAAAFAATRGELKSADVLKIAASWEAWVSG